MKATAKALRKSNPKKWTQAALAVTFAVAQRVSEWLSATTIGNGNGWGFAGLLHQALLTNHSSILMIAEVVEGPAQAHTRRR